MTPEHIENAKKAIAYASSLPNPTGARCGNCTKVIKDPDAPSGFCCMQCSENKSEDLSQSTLRKLVFERDGGRCALCRCDTVKLRDEIDSLLRMAEEADKRNDPRARQLWKARVHQLGRLGFDRHAVESGASLHEVDHIKPRAAGGASTVEACRTLCIACHHKITAAFARSRADARKPKRRIGR